MVIEKLTSVVFTIENNIQHEQLKLQAAKKISSLLKQIDLASEVIPMEDPERMSRLLISLKGDQLDSYETRILYELSHR